MNNNKQYPSNKNEKPSFNWTDALVQELILCLPNYDTETYLPIIEQFKQSKQQPVESSKVSVLKLDHLGQNYISNPTDGYTYSLMLDIKEIPEDKYEAVKKAIERVLNSEVTLTEGIPTLKFSDFFDIEEWDKTKNETRTFKAHGFECTLKPIQDIPTLDRQENWAIKEVDWEIYAFKSKYSDQCAILKDNGKYTYDGGGGTWPIANMLSDPSVTIHSVKRVSDNQYFTVGDKFTVYSGCDLTIKSFDVVEEIHFPSRMKVASIEYDGYDLSKIKKASLQRIPETQTTSNESITCTNTYLVQVCNETDFLPVPLDIKKFAERKKINDITYGWYNERTYIGIKDLKR